MKKNRQITNSKKNPKPINPTAILVLENGTFFKGFGLGYEGVSTGEVCFNTSITGYQEIMSDPSYAGQIINFTFPHIGNVGTNKEDNESNKVWTKGVIFNSEITNPSNYRSLMKLDLWLKKNKIVGLTGLDTRSLTNLIRDKGAPRGTISYDRQGNFGIKKLINSTLKWPGLNGLDLAKTVSTKYRFVWKGFKTWTKEQGYKKIKKKKLKVVAIDYGIKTNILRYLSNFYCDVIVVPCEASAEDILALKPSGIFLSNGPGDPDACDYAITAIKELLKTPIPIFGICLGYQLLALAANAKTIKMKFGHHGANHPVIDLSSGKVVITSQNHGFAVDAKTLPSNLNVTHTSLFDGTLQGVQVKNKNAFGFQGHPEASPGPHDLMYIFNKFIENIKRYKKQ